jgi:DNA-directed RNA polymerase I, II, and III subunit RPABC3
MICWYSTAINGVTAASQAKGTGKRRSRGSHRIAENHGHRRFELQSAAKPCARRRFKLLSSRQTFFRARPRRCNTALDTAYHSTTRLNSFYPKKSPQTATMGDAQVFEETFNITSINNEKYDRVSRLYGSSSDASLTMTLDINHELFPVAIGESINLVLATTLSLDGTAKEGAETMWRNVSKQGTATLADMYDYVCYGKNYRFEDADGGAETV